MRSLAKPNLKVEDIYCECSEHFRDKELVKRLVSCKSKIVEAAEDFDVLASEHETFKMNENLANKGIVTGNELKKIYTEKMAAPNSIGKKYYSQILSIPHNDLCPLCGARMVSTLDHYLPKAKYPSLSVTPNNLIASCRDCNFDKSDTEFISSEDETLHPYYDNIENHRWLFCDVIESDPIVFKFTIKMVDTTDDVLYRRIANHFDTFNLSKLYSVKAGEMISGIEVMLKRLYSRVGEDAVRLQIEEDIISYESSALNSWQSAFYRGIKNSEWFFTNWITDK